MKYQHSFRMAMGSVRFSKYQLAEYVEYNNGGDEDLLAVLARLDYDCRRYATMDGQNPVSILFDNGDVADCFMEFCDGNGIPYEYSAEPVWWNSNS